MQESLVCHKIRRRVNGLLETVKADPLAFQFGHDLDQLLQRPSRSRRHTTRTSQQAFDGKQGNGERGIILEALDALNAIGVQDEEFLSAIRAFACFTADGPTVALEEPDHLQSLFIGIGVALLQVRPTHPAEPSSNAPPRI